MGWPLGPTFRKVRPSAFVLEKVESLPGSDHHTGCKTSVSQLILRNQFLTLSFFSDREFSFSFSTLAITLIIMYI